jgi:Actinobacteria/chloroflexi VLRF1 release factor
VSQDGARPPATHRSGAPVRRLEVDPGRLPRWVEGFAARHGDPRWSARDGELLLSAPDGAEALVLPLAADGAAPSGVAALAAWAEPAGGTGLVLVRRGGYAVGVGEGEDLTVSKVGTRHVQSRTAAGGWSQQRYARRRGNQADELVAAVAGHALRVVVPSLPTHLVVGGDRTLVAKVLADPRLAGLARLPGRELYDLPDPRLTVLQQALRRGRAVRIRLLEDIGEVSPIPGPMPPTTP